MITRIVTYILCATVLLSFIVPPHLYVYNYPADDAYFYLQVASHIYSGDGSTFNQITATNGYHPLWMLCCVALFALSGGSKCLALHLAIALQQAMALLIIFLFFRICRALKLRFAFIVLPLLLLYFTTRLYVSEAYVNGLFVLLTLGTSLLLATADEEKPVWLYFLNGLFAGLALLARLDNLFVIGTLLTATALMTAKKHRLFSPFTLKRIAVLGITCLAVFVPYLAYNQITFGHLVPVSGAIKSTLPHLGFHLNGLSGIGKVGTLFALINLVLCATPLVNRKQRFVLLTLAIGVLLHAGQIVFTTHHHTDWPWYYFSFVYGLCFGLAIVIEHIVSAPQGSDIPVGPILRSGPAEPLRIKRHLFQKITTPLIPILLPLALLLCLAVNMYAALRYRSSAPLIMQSFERERLAESPDQRWQQHIADWLKNNLPAETGIAVFDWPGMFAYTSGMRILPIDGLINDYRYNDDVLAEGINQFLSTRNVRYWLGPMDPKEMEQQNWYRITPIPNGQQIEVFAPLYKKSAGTFTVTDDQLVTRFEASAPHRDMPALGLWAIQTDYGQ